MPGRATRHQRLIGHYYVVGRGAGRDADLPAQPQIQRKIRPDLPGVLAVKLILGVPGIELESALGPRIPLRHESAVDLAYTAQQEIDVGLEVGTVEGGVEIGGNPESGRVHGVDAGGEIDFLRGIETAYGAALILLTHASQVGTELEGVCA